MRQVEGLPSYFEDLPEWTQNAMLTARAKQWLPGVQRMAAADVVSKRAEFERASKAENAARANVEAAMRSQGAEQRYRELQTQAQTYRDQLALQDERIANAFGPGYTGEVDRPRPSAAPMMRPPPEYGRERGRLRGENDRLAAEYGRLYSELSAGNRSAQNAMEAILKELRDNRERMKTLESQFVNRR